MVQPKLLELLVNEILYNTLMLRKFIVFLAASGLTLLLFTTAMTTSVINTVQPNNIKTILRASKIYDNVVDTVIAQAKDSQKQNQVAGNAESSTPFDDPAVQAIIKKTITPTFIQSTFEQLIDGTTPWLEGKTTKPTFKIDLTTIKGTFADNLGAYSRDRLASIPVCTKGQIPDSTDPLKINCKPKGFNADAEIAKTVSNIKTGQDFIANPIITADTITVGEGVTKLPLYQKYQNAPQYYQLVQQLPMILGGLTLLSALIIIFVSEDRRRGVRKVMSGLVVVGVILLLEVWAISMALTKLQTKLDQSNSATAAINTIVKTVTNLVKTDINKLLTYFGVVYIAIGLVTGLVLVLTRNKSAKTVTDNSKDEIPIKADDSAAGPSALAASTKPSETKPIKTSPTKHVQG